MAKPPAVVMIARHGMRLDAADQQWHMSTPTPYDPPLTYGGWNQCRALGVRIASLLHAREQELNHTPSESAEHGGVRRASSLKRKRRTHRVVIHTSPFLRCVQTSIAISAGIAQYQPPKETISRPGTGRPRVTTQLHSASPRLRGLDGLGSLHSLTPIIEPEHTLGNGLLKTLSGEATQHAKSKLRVDAFLGEWMNPTYFEHITPPPPSPMMVAGAKAELLQNDSVDVYTPSVPVRSNGGNLWSPTPAAVRPSSRDSSLDDWSPISDSLPIPGLRRDRGSSVSSVASNDSGSGRKSPFRPGHVMSPFQSTLTREKTTAYVPPTPTYSVSSSDTIPRGYVAHARTACADVDIQWDSSRPPQDWGDGGAYGEEWSEMHRRFRGGLNELVDWYSQHSPDDRDDDVGAPDHVRVDDDVEEDLVVVLVTHGAGSNALIGALTGQPVLMDVGMASLTMAVRKEDAPVAPNAAAYREDSDMFVYDERRRGSIDMGLSNAYEMKFVASSEHLRAGADPNKTGSIFNSRRPSETLSKPQFSFDGSNDAATFDNKPNIDSNEPRHSNTSTALGTIRRPSAPTNIVLADPIPGRLKKSNTTSHGFGSAPTTPMSVSTGLWTPPALRNTPPPPAPETTQSKDELPVRVHAISEIHSEPVTAHDVVVASESVDSYMDVKPIPHSDANGKAFLLNGSGDENKTEARTIIIETGDLGTLAAPLSRGLNTKGLWGSRPTGGDHIPRRFPDAPKRRWTVVGDQ